MPELRLIEMVCDWAAIQYEIHLFNYPRKFNSVIDFYNYGALKKHFFSNMQKYIIEDNIKTLELNFNNDAKLHQIWKTPK